MLAGNSQKDLKGLAVYGLDIRAQLRGKEGDGVSSAAREVA